jgi:hypothetical protein
MIELTLLGLQTVRDSNGRELGSELSSFSRDQARKWPKRRFYVLDDADRTEP